ncbi:MAG: helix-turn-helix domain-containing protein, partial [Chloroflexota bacterium]
MLKAARDTDAGPLLGALTGREHQLAILVAQGATNREIAGAMFISEHTVKIHIGNILTKLDLRNRQQLC